MRPSWLVAVTTAPHINLCACFPAPHSTTSSPFCPIHLPKFR